MEEEVKIIDGVIAYKRCRFKVIYVSSMFPTYLMIS